MEVFCCFSPRGQRYSSIPSADWDTTVSLPIGLNYSFLSKMFATVSFFLSAMRTV